MKAITFLGTGQYKETTYWYDNETAPVTEIFPVALCHFFKPDEILVLVTDGAEKKWFDNFNSQCTAKLHKCPVVRPIKIPDGHSVEDLWKIFGELTKHLNEKDEVVFDITHSFRTLPFLSFLAASFLRVAKDVQIKGIYYGAWEARNPPPPNDNPFASNPSDKSPVFNLTPFLELLTWTTATDLFLRTGNSLSLAEQLNSYSSEEMKVLAENLKGISQGLSVLRPLETMEKSVALQENLNEAKSAIQISAPAFELLFKKISITYNGLGKSKSDAKNKDTSKSRVDKQIKMVSLYRANNRVVHALALARETLVSLICLHLGIDDLDKNFRTAAEYFINNKDANNRDNQVIKNKLNVLKEDEKNGKFDVENLKKLRGLAKDLFSIRNEVLHCGLIRERAKTASAVFEESKKHLDKFFEVCGLWMRSPKRK